MALDHDATRVLILGDSHVFWAARFVGLAWILAWTDSDFAFPDINVVKTLLAMLSTLRLVAGSKHAPRAFGSATWQAGASSDQGIHQINQNARKDQSELSELTYIKTSHAVFLPRAAYKIVRI